MPNPMLRHPINATFTLSVGANGDDHTFDGITVVAEIATADFFRKFLLDGFIVRFFVGLIGSQFTKFKFNIFRLKGRFKLFISEIHIIKKHFKLCYNYIE